MRGICTALVVLMFAVTGVAVAGEQPTPPGFTPVPGSVAIAPVSDPDPDGGAPWGMRTFRTEDGADCAQVGRLQDGKLGRVDENGVFTESTTGPGGCSGPPPDDNPARPKSWGFGLQLTNIGENGCRLPGQRDPDNVAECTDRNVRSVFYGQFGTLLKRVTFADPDGSNPREIAVGPNGEYVAVVRGSVNDATQPIQRLYFDGGCGPDAKWLLQLAPGTRVVDCQIIVPLDRPRPHPESAASKRARKNPSKPSPVKVKPKVAGPGRRISVLFKVPITVGVPDAYSYRLEGPAGCRKKFRNNANGFKGYDQMVRGKWADLLLPLGGKAGHWCKGTYTVSVFFRSGTKTYKPFGSDTFRIK